MKTAFLFISLVLSASVCSGQTVPQDKLVFHKKKNPGRTYSIPLDKSPVFVKPQSGRRMICKIASFNDSTLTIKALNKSKSANDMLIKIYNNPRLTREERDRKADSIRYSDVRQMKWSEVKRITVTRWKKSWVPAALYITGIASYVLFYEYEAALGHSPGIPFPAVALGYGGIIYYFSLKRVNMKRWSPVK